MYVRKIDKQQKNHLNKMNYCFYQEFDHIQDGSFRACSLIRGAKSRNRLHISNDDETWHSYI